VSILLDYLWTKAAMALPFWGDAMRVADAEFKREAWEAQPWYKKTIFSSYPEIFADRTQLAVGYLCVFAFLKFLIWLVGGPVD